MYSRVLVCAIAFLLLASITPSQCSRPKRHAKVGVLRGVDKNKAESDNGEVPDMHTPKTAGIQNRVLTNRQSLQIARSVRSQISAQVPFQYQQQDQHSYTQSHTSSTPQWRTTPNEPETHVALRQHAAQPLHSYHKRRNKNRLLPTATTSTARDLKAVTSRVTNRLSTRRLLDDWWPTRSYSNAPIVTIRKSEDLASSPPPSCNGNRRNKYPPPLWIRVQLAIACCEAETDDTTKLENKCSLAVSQHLQLHDSTRTLDTKRVECVVHSRDSSYGDVWMDVYIWLTPGLCEVVNQLWQDLVTSKPSALFGTDKDLAQAVRNVTAESRDAGMFVKLAIQSSQNAVTSITITGSGGEGASISNGDNSEDGVTAAEGINDDDYVPIDGIYYMTPFTPGPNYTGLIVMGITTVSLFAVLALLILMQKWAARRLRAQQEAAFTAAVHEAQNRTAAAIAGAAAMAAQAQRADTLDSDSSTSSIGTVAHVETTIASNPMQI